MTGRSVPEWIGRTPDSKVPDHVRLRIFRDHEGRCHISGRKSGPADAWDVEHVIPLSMGGEHRESNLAPALRDKHKEKTRVEAKARARGDAAAKRHLGLTKPKHPMPGSRNSKWRRRMDGTVERRGTP
ncbi:MAG: HNH endonuclease [Devosia sp.]